MILNNILTKGTQALGVFFTVLIFTPELLAVPANNNPYSIIQPDGTTLQVRKYGDEHGSWVETLSGRTIDKSLDGYWRYVQSYTGKTPVLSNKIVKQATPTLIVDYGTVRPPIDNIPSFDDSQLRPGPLQPSVLYILVDYADTPATYTDVSSWADQITSVDVNKKTIADYYEQASYGAVNISPAEETHENDNDGVIGWLRLEGDHPVNREITGSSSMAAEANDIVREAIAAADPHINFVSYDLNNDLAIDPSELAIVVVVAGHEASNNEGALPNVWGHANKGIIVETSDIKYISETECTPVSPNLTSKPGYHGPTEICKEVLVEYLISVVGAAEIGEIHENNHQATLGVSVHELGHLIFGLPDLYDLDEEDKGLGIGGFGVMGAGSWGMDFTTDSFDGETPVLPSAWTQFKLQWVDAHAWGPIVSAGRNNIPATKPTIGIAHIGSDSETGLWRCSDTEYFLMQYRADVGYDRGLRKYLSWQDDSFTPGLLILHVDESQNTNSFNSRRLVDVEEANGLEVGAFNPTRLYNEHLWFDGNFTLFNDITTPNSNPNGSPGFSSLDSSNVEVEIFNSSVSYAGNEEISIQIKSACDVPRFSTSVIP